MRQVAFSFIQDTVSSFNCFLFYINAEFRRLVAVPLEEKFMAQLDMHSSQLIRVIRARGGATRQKTADIMDTLDQVDL